VCGIGGTTEDALTKQIMAAIRHRGPDMHDTSKQKGLTLCHHRLSIIDLSPAGKQPMQYKHYSISFNGEIYNYDELAKKHLKGHVFKGGSDTEVILHLYEKFGEKCLPLLRGMWAFAIHDTKKNTLFLSVDRFGKKPIYYRSEKKGNFSFASEGRAIIKPNEPIDEYGLRLYRNYGYIQAPFTIWKHIKKMTPATWLRVSLTTGAQQQGTYWKPPTKELRITYEAALTQTQALLKKSVDYRFVADVPVGCFLSGGVDSSIIAALSHDRKKAQGEELHTFSIAFDDPKYDESAYAQEVADHLGTKHHQEKVSIKDLKVVFKQLPTIYSEPFADSSALPTYLVSKVARKKVTVSLSGDGADELFGGYRTYNHQLRLHALNKTPAKFLLPARFRGNYQHTYNGLLGSPENIDVFDGLLKKKTDPWVAQLSKADLHHYMPYDILVKVDRASMQHALEVRNPFLDHDVAEFALSLPDEYKIAQPIPLLKFVNKRILKDAYRSQLPSVVFNRKKMGFAIPQHTLTTDLGEQYIDWRKVGIEQEPTKAVTYRDHVLAQWIDHAYIHK
jgi:asparagine synthase (glutamine-hydrolysing)